MFPRLPPLNSVRTFEAAARHLSFNRAAEELHVTPSAVSHQIRCLEDFLGVRLFRRLPRQVVLTPEGQRYLPRIRSAIGQIGSATEEIMAQRGSGPLTISVVPSFASRWLVPRLVGFQMAYPDIEVRLITSVGSVDFTTSDVDLAIRHGMEKWRRARSHELTTENVVPVCNPRLLEGPHALRRPEDLRHATLLHVLPRLGEWRAWLNAAGVTDCDPERGPKFMTYSLALKAAVAGLGVAMADRHLVGDDLKSGRLLTPFDIELVRGSTYYLVYPEERANDYKITAFRDWLFAEIPPHASANQAEAGS